MDETRKKILRAIKVDLEHGDIVEIARRTGLTREYVGYCLNWKNDIYNSKIVDAAIELIKDRKEKEEQLLNDLTADH